LKTRRISTEFVALCANGRPINRANGFAPIATRPNFSTAVAAIFGIHSKLAENARRALINGVGLRVYDARVGRATKIGMNKKLRLW